MNAVSTHIASLSDGKDTYLGRATIEETLQQMKRIATLYSYQVASLALELKGKDRKTSANNIWNWVRKHIRYQKDVSGKEELRRPARVIKDQAGDCDCTSILISALLQNLGIPHFFRVVDVTGEGWEHVYIVVIDELENLIYLDTVPEIPYFNFEHPHIKKQDFYMKNLAGIDSEELILINTYLSEIMLALNKFEETEEIKLEKALVKTVRVYLNDANLSKKVIENAYQRSIYFKEVYKELLGYAMNGLGVIPVVAAGAVALVNSNAGKAIISTIGSKVTGAISNLLKKGGKGGIGQTTLSPGDIFEDQAGNTVKILSDYDSGLGYSMSINNGASTSAVRASEAAIGIDGKIYLRNRGGKDKDPEYFLIEKGASFAGRQNIKLLYKADKNSQGEWPKAVLDAFEAQIVAQNASAQQSVQQYATTTQISSQPTGTQTDQSASRSLTITTENQDPEKGNNESFYEKNKTLIMVVVAIVLMITVGSGIFLMSKKSK